jgi:hypothetical protein
MVIRYLIKKIKAYFSKITAYSVTKYSYYIEVYLSKLAYQSYSFKQSKELKLTFENYSPQYKLIGYVRIVFETL